jgi:hypothetical protein
MDRFGLHEDAAHKHHPPLFELSFDTTASICETGRILGIEILAQNP